MICYIIYMSIGVIIITHRVLCDILGGINKMILLSAGISIKDLSASSIFDFLAVGIILWFIIKQFLDMRKTAKDQIVKEQSWDKAAKVVEEKEKVWDNAVNEIKGKQVYYVDRYDKRFDEIEKRIEENHTELESRINENHKDTERRIADVSEGLLVLTRCSRAILDGLHQLNCNGKVTEASQELDEYLVNLVGK